MFKKVVLGDLKSFFQLNHELVISLYFMKATPLCYS